MFLRSSPSAFLFRKSRRDEEKSFSEKALDGRVTAILCIIDFILFDLNVKFELFEYGLNR